MAKTLLVVDDSATMRKVFEMTFAGEEIAIVTHDGGDSLLARARETHPDAIVVDVALARGASGYDVCRALKSDAALARVPVLMLYSEQQPLDEARARDAGAEFSLLKPFDTQAAIDKVKQSLGLAPGAPQPGITAPPGAPRPTAAASGPAPSPPGPPVPQQRPASAGFGSVGAPQPPNSPPKSTQMFSSAPIPAAPGPPAATARPKRDSGEVEIVMDDDEEIPPVAARAPAPAPSAAARPAPPAAQPFASAPPAAAPAPRAAPPGPANHFVPSGPAPWSPVAASSVSAPMAAMSAEVGQRVAAMGLTPAQAEAVTALTREVVERVVWEVVPQLAETLIREEIRRLTAE